MLFEHLPEVGCDLGLSWVLGATQAGGLVSIMLGWSRGRRWVCLSQPAGDN